MSNKMPEQLDRWAKAIRESRKRKELANYEKQRSIVSDNTQLYETCLTFLASAVERKDDERARYWSRTAFQYAPPIETKEQWEANKRRRDARAEAAIKALRNF
jgi:hypothetical protein